MRSVILTLLGCGFVGVAIGNYGSSEHRMMKQLYASIPQGSLLLADDLYSSYGHINYCKNTGIDIITQGKHKRNEKHIKTLAKNDEIVAWKAGIKPDWYDENTPFADTILVRKITYVNPKKPKEKISLYTI